MINQKQILNISAYAGEIILSNGGEIYRTEDTISRICKAYGIKYVNSLVTPTGIFISVDNGDGDSETVVRRIHNRRINLNKISLVNNFSRKLENELLNYQKAMEELGAIEYGSPETNLKAGVLLTSLGVSTNVIIMKESYNNILPAFLATLASQIVIKKIGFLKDVNFIPEIAAGFIGTIVSLIAFNNGLGDNLSIMIVTAILPFVPGVSLTNSIRDAISGDLISATSRGMEAFLIAISLAVGVALALGVLR
ncbi:threonine/serine ThrE exporter family protein [Halonatronum saccharophilum]|uniref:threonine/serine ThrE exporter family protein n=1 Tax=Halonatronum saccharophilum TaxID=150060 RepID=UPI00048094E4|nr:threonine/serine exporter family protein [Halonatronum saccharophilum]